MQEQEKKESRRRREEEEEDVNYSEISRERDRERSSMSGIPPPLRPGSRADQRRKGFKKALDADESRRKREDQMTQVRREKREESLQKRRFAGPGAGATNGMSSAGASSSVTESTNDAVISSSATMEQKV